MLVFLFSGLCFAGGRQSLLLDGFSSETVHAQLLLYKVHRKIMVAKKLMLTSFL